MRIDGCQMQRRTLVSSEYLTTRGNVARLIMALGRRRRKGKGKSEPAVRAALCGLCAAGRAVACPIAAPPMINFRATGDCIDRARQSEEERARECERGAT